MIVEVDRGAGEFRKRAETSEEAERLRHEARVLDVARHPGVVQLLGLDGDILRLRLVDGERLGDLPHPGTNEMAALAVAAMTTLADLHDLGVVHGAVTSEHVLVDRAGQPILCSFGRGALRDDDGADGAHGPACAQDVATLAATLEAATTAGPDTPATLTGRLAAAAAAGPDTPATLPGQLAAAAAGSNAPSARRLATQLAAPARHGPRRPGRLVLIAAPLMVATALVALVAIEGGHSNPGPGTGPGPRPGPGPPLPSCPAVDRGCRPLPRPGGVIVTAAGRYRIGEAGDQVVVGRWHCAAALPALLDPASGEVWVWDSWARGAGPGAARAVTRVSGARSVQVDPQPSGCDRLRVGRDNGGAVVIQPGHPA